MIRRLLLISNSTNYGEEYLGWPRDYISAFLNEQDVKDVLFIPYAGVGLASESLIHSYDVYEEKVQKVFGELGFNILSVHHSDNPARAVSEAKALAVGGGNTFHLVHEMQKHGLMGVIRERVAEGMPYMGWSAGSNVACPSLKTTNDMPIIEPQSFDCLNLIPFQINPHYLDAHPDGHGGETREQRIEEFLIANKSTPVVGLREACLLEVKDDHMELFGNNKLRLFQFGSEPKELDADSDLDFLLR